MLFSKLKAKTDELLPPPPPFPSMELEEEEKPAKKAASKDEFEDLFEEVESLKIKKEPKPFKIKAPKIEKPIVKAKQKPIAIKKAKPVKLKPAKPFKEAKLVKRLPQIKIKASAVKAIKAKPKAKELKFQPGPMQAPEIEPAPIEKPEIEELEQIEEPKTEFEFPGLEEAKGSGFDEHAEVGPKPREIQEAEDEIKAAIEKIKAKERPSFFQKLFAKKEKQEIVEKPAADGISAIKDYIANARDALMKFDLESAKRDYIEIMKIYNRISLEEQAKVYQDIKELYSERKSAEELKV